MERGARRPDLPQLAQATVRAAVAAAVDLLPEFRPLPAAIPFTCQCDRPGGCADPRRRAEFAVDRRSDRSSQEEVLIVSRVRFGATGRPVLNRCTWRQARWA
jgi:hypothetical protein